MEIFLSNISTLIAEHNLAVNIGTKIILFLMAAYYFSMMTLEYRSDGGWNDYNIKRENIMIVLSFLMFIISFFVSGIWNIRFIILNLLINYCIKVIFEYKESLSFLGEAKRNIKKQILKHFFIILFFIMLFVLFLFVK